MSMDRKQERLVLSPLAFIVQIRRNRQREKCLGRSRSFIQTLIVWTLLAGVVDEACDKQRERRNLGEWLWREGMRGRPR